MPPSPPQIPMTKGDLALVLSGDKWLHFVPGQRQFQMGDLVHLVHGEGSDRIVVPARISAALDATGHKLSEASLRNAGRLVKEPPTPAKASPVHDETRPRSKREAKQRANESGSVFLAAMEPAMPTNLSKNVTAAEMAGTDADEHVQQLQLHVPRISDYPSPNEPGIAPDEAAARAAIMRETKHALKHAADMLAPEMLHAHRYVNKQMTRREHPAPPDDASILLAMRYLMKHRAPGKEALLKNLHAPSRWFSLELALSHKRTATLLPYENADGIGRVQYLADYPTIETTLGTGTLASMGAIARIVTRQPVRQNHIFYEEEPGANRPRPCSVATVRARQRNRATAGAHDFSFDVPVLIDFSMDEEVFRVNEINTVTAKEHGYASADDMRRGLGIAKGENPLLHSYAVRPALPKHLPEDEDRAGKRIIERRLSAYHAWTRSGDTSILPAKRYLETLEPETAAGHVDSITPRRHKAAPELMMKHNGKGPVPADVQALRELGVDALTPTRNLTARDHQRNRASTAGKAQRAAKATKIVAGTGWAASLAPRHAKEERAPSDGVSYRHVPIAQNDDAKQDMLATAYPTLQCTPGEMLLVLSGLQTRLFSHVNPAPTPGRVYILQCSRNGLSGDEDMLRIPIIATSVSMIDASAEPDPHEWMQAGQQYHHRNGHARLHNMGFRLPSTRTLSELALSKDQLRNMLHTARDGISSLMDLDPVDRDASLNRADLFCRREHHLSGEETQQRIAGTISKALNPPKPPKEVVGWGAVAEQLRAEALADKAAREAGRRAANIKANRVAAKARAAAIAAQEDSKAR